MSHPKKPMKLVIKVQDAVTLARRFRESPQEAMHSLVVRLREEMATTLERVIESQLELLLGEPEEATNKRNGFQEKVFVIKGLGELLPSGLCNGSTDRLFDGHR
jgi:hypothetical protein